MKIKISIKNRITGSIIFEFEKENNTIKDTVNEASLQGADLRYADLRYADLQDASLQGADLQDADLRYASLQGADLRYASLQGADLRYADLQGADLRYASLQGADLQDADLRYASLQDADLRYASLRGAEKIQKAIIFTGLYKYIVIPYLTESGEKRIKMGCHNRSLTEWESDFWNNLKEFPNDNSLKSNLRLIAFETAKKWFELIETSKK